MTGRSRRSRYSGVIRWDSPTPLLVITTVLMVAVAGVLLAVLLTRLGSPAGAVVLDVGAAQAGVEEVLTDPINGYGRYVRINHGNGYETAYGHMSSIAVSSGDSVKKGDVIGYVGSSGYSTGPHLHFEVLLNGQTVNPLKILNY